MKTCIGAALVVAALSITPALAQEDHNNPAPSYPSRASATPPNADQPALVHDSNNPAPNYPASASAAPANAAPAARINNSNNPAPNYAAATPPSASPQKATRHAATSHKMQHATHRHHARAHG